MIAAHADWSVAPGKRWMAVAEGAPGGWVADVEPVGDLATLFGRLLGRAGGGPVVLGVDFPLGLPRAYVRRHLAEEGGFPAFLASLAGRPGFFEVAETLAEVSAARPFYPRRGLRGMTRLSHAAALGLEMAGCLSRACDHATVFRPAGAPLFWTLGANQSGKAAISAWRDLLLPALAEGTGLVLWPFDGPLLGSLRAGAVTVAETYPAEAMRQIGVRPVGSKRRAADRAAMAPAIVAAMEDLGVRAGGRLAGWLASGFGADAAGEDRMDCVLGLLCVAGVLAGRRPDAPPPDPWLSRWEGWVLGQTG